MRDADINFRIAMPTKHKAASSVRCHLSGNALDALSGFLRPFIVVLEKLVQKIRINVTHHRAVRRPSVLSQ
ncbi:hypothetical protein, partial [Pseudomonas syringae group genomosp. 3]|uniref:hypothetical protein n=1 Tax=Pseudomonas syringae group genomosp. 3 TaxID=251701 RepID=UPI001C3F2772